MNILKIIHGYPPLYSAGSEVYSQHICNQLGALGHQVTVFTREENPYRPDFELRREVVANNIELYYANMPRDKDGYIHPEIDKQFANLLKQKDIDIAHIGHLNHLSTGLVGELKQANIPIVFTLHDFWLMCPRGQFLQRNFDGKTVHQLCDGQANEKCALSCYRMLFSGDEAAYEEDLAYWSSWIGRRMQATRSLAKAVDLFIAPSKYLRNRFVHEFGLPTERVHYLDYGFPTESLSAVEPPPASPFVFGYIGTHIPAKGVNLLIAAFGQLKVEAKLKIWGWKDAKSQQALRKMSQAKGHSIEFCGAYANEDIRTKVFEQVHAIVVPSIWGENSPLVIHEAQACRVPVITADYGGMAEYVQHQVNGLLFEHRRANALATQMDWAVKHPQLIQNLGKRGYLYSQTGQVPDIKTHCKILEKLYRNVISQQNSTSTLASNY